MASRQGSKTIVAVGPWGGSGGGRWSDPNEYDGIRKITIFHGHAIDSIRVVYVKNDIALTEQKHGGNGGGQTDIDLQYPGEYLIGVSGTFATFSHVRTPIVRSLTLQSNRHTYGPFGMQTGTPFSLPIQEGRIISIFGSSGMFLDSIGFHIAKD